MVELVTKAFLIFTLLACSSLAGINPNTIIKKNKGKIPPIRVRIAKSLNEIVVTGTDLERRIHIQKNRKKYKGRKSVKFNCSNISFKKRNKPILLASLASPTGLVSLKKEKYKGKLHVMTSVSKKKCDVINEVDTESYISTLLSKEMNNTWPIEALKAQAVAARTYALHKIGSKQVSRAHGHDVYFDLENSEKHQVSGNFFDATVSTQKATKETKGYVLLDEKGLLAPAFFHAKCGGKTLRPDQVWTNTVTSYKSVKCPFCNDHGKRSWNSSFSKKNLVNFLNWAKNKKVINKKGRFTTSNKIMVVPDRASTSKFRVYAEDQLYLIEKSQLRRYFGRVKVKSNNFKTIWKKNKLVLSGAGRGHGVGMCQLGALDLAQRGWDFKRILAHYFPAHRLIKLY